MPEITSVEMIPRIKTLKPMENFELYVEFDDGYKVIYDVKDDIRDIAVFKRLEDENGLFSMVNLDTSRTCVYWDDELDLASDSIYEYGKRV